MGLRAAEKAKGLTSTTSASYSTSESSLKSWKSASKSSSMSTISDLRGFEKRLPQERDFFFRSGQRYSAVRRRDRGVEMKSDIIAPPHILYEPRSIKVWIFQRFAKKFSDFSDNEKNFFFSFLGSFWK